MKEPRAKYLPTPEEIASESARIFAENVAWMQRHPECGLDRAPQWRRYFRKKGDYEDSRLDRIPAEALTYFADNRDT